MTERGGLLRAVLENPADDVPRLVFADWLDEHGEHPRAELIRVQCRLAELRRLPPRSDEEEVDRLGELGRLESREQDLIWNLDVPGAWSAPVLDRLRLRRDFCRGFVEVIEMGIRSLRELPTVLAGHPIRTVRIPGLTVRIACHSHPAHEFYNAGSSWTAEVLRTDEHPRRDARWQTRCEMIAGLVPWLSEVATDRGLDEALPDQQ